MPEPRVDTFVPGTIAGTATAATKSSHAAGRTAGYAAGYAAGARAAAQAAAAQAKRIDADHERREAARDHDIAQVLQALAGAVDQWRNMAAPVLATSEELLHQGAIDVAQAIVGRELTPGPGTAVDVLQRALSVPVGVTPTAIRVSQVDLPHIERALADNNVALPDGVILTTDPSLKPGDAVTEHPHGVLDARIDAAISRARAALEESP